MMWDGEHAARSGSVDQLQVLLSDGVDVDARDRHGQTALMLAAMEGHVEVVDWLIARGCALDHTAKYGLSALMLAAIRGHVEVVRALTGAGSNVYLRGTGPPGFPGKTAMDLAMARGNAEIAEILRSTLEARPDIGS